MSVHDHEEEKLRQLRLIHKLATRLPWIMVALSLFAFFVIFISVLLQKLSFF